MIDSTGRFEEELRGLYAQLPAPPAPPAWSRSQGARSAACRPWRWRRSLRLPTARIAAVLAAAVIVAIGATVSLHPTTGVAISVLPSGAGLNCRLPVSALSNDHTTGFIVFRDGQASFEPVQTGGTTFIPALRVWADVLPQMVAPDGQSYVSQDFSAGRTLISVTDARGRRTLVDTTAPLNVFGYSPMGILVIDQAGPAGVAAGPTSELELKLIDPQSGAVRPFPFAPPPLPLSASSESGYSRLSNAIWLMVAAPGQGTVVSRYDLATGSTTEWLTPSDVRGTATVVGADSHGAPIIQVADSDINHTDPAHRAGIPIQTLLVARPHQLTVLNHGRTGGAGVAGPLSPLSVTDGSSVWLASDDGAIWLYRPASGLVQVAKVTTSNRGAPGVAISGPCS